MELSQQTILVIGATGMLGQPVTRYLQANGSRVRILTRTPAKARAIFDPAITLYQGDVADEQTLIPALEGCDGIHISLKGGPRPRDYERVEQRGVQAIVRAAQKAGIRQISYLSAYTVTETTALSAETRAKWRAEEIIRASGIPYTIFRPTWFMESLPLFLQGKQAVILGRQPHLLHWLAARDYARMVGKSFTTPAAWNKIFYLYGPEAMTMRDALQRYCQLVAPGTQMKTISPRLIQILGKITFNAELSSTGEIMAYYNNFGETGDPTEANTLLGKPETTLSQWCSLRQSEVASG